MGGHLYTSNCSLFLGIYCTLPDTLFLKMVTYSPILRILWWNAYLHLYFFLSPVILLLPRGGCTATGGTMSALQIFPREAHGRTRLLLQRGITEDGNFNSNAPILRHHVAFTSALVWLVSFKAKITEVG